nr:hypothetical protein [Tanacetum cinerariifolium]
MVAILEKTKHNTDFHQIVNFLEASHIRYALTIHPTIYVSHIRQFWSIVRVETTDGETKILAQVNGRQRTVSESSIRRHLKLNDKEELFASMLVPQGEGSEHPSEPHHIPSAQDESIHHEQITQSPQHAQITSPEPIPQSHKQTTSQEPTIPSQSYYVITTPRRITRGTIRISQSKVPSPGVDETAFPIGDVRYGEAFPTDTSLDAGQDRENIAKTSAMPHEKLPRVTSLGGGEGKKRRIYSGRCSKHWGMDQGEDLVDRDKSADKGSDSTDEMSHVLCSLGAANILASGGLREQAKRDSEIARIHAEKELEMMIAELDRSNEMVAKYLSEYEQAALGLSHDEKLDKERSKKLKTTKASGTEPTQEQQSEEPKELSEEELKKMMGEDLDKLWSLVKETCSTPEVTNEKAKELWVELKRLYEHDSRDPLWALQRWSIKFGGGLLGIKCSKVFPLLGMIIPTVRLSVPTADVYIAKKLATIEDFALLHDDKIYSELKMRVCYI